MFGKQFILRVISLLQNSTVYVSELALENEVYKTMQHVQGECVVVSQSGS